MCTYYKYSIFVFPSTNKKCLTPLFWLIPNLLYGMWVQGYHFTAEKLEVLMLKGRENDLG